MAITGVSGTLTHGSTVTLSGSGFGDKSSQPGPTMYDNFAAGTTGNAVSGNAPLVRNGALASMTWGQDNNTGTGPLYNATSPKARQTKHARSTFSTNASWYSNLQFTRSFTTTGQKAFLTFYGRTNVNAEMPRQSKIFIAYQAGTDRYYLSTAYDRCEAGGWRSHITTGPDESFHDYTGPNLVAEWSRYEMYFKQSGTASANGAVETRIWRASVPSVSVAAHGAVQTRNSASDWSTWAIGGGYYDMCDSADPGSVDIAEVYFDDTPMRVELGNASTWAAVTRAEIQRPTAWNAGGTSIDVVLNAGGFGDSDTAWLYVFDDNNNPLFSGAGFQVTLGSGGGGGSDPDPVRSLHEGEFLTTLERQTNRRVISKW